MRAIQYSIGFFVFILWQFLGVFTYNIFYIAQNLEGLLINLVLAPSFLLMLWSFSGLLLIFLISACLSFEKKIVISFFGAMIVLVACGIAARGLFRAYQFRHFFESGNSVNSLGFLTGDLGRARLFHPNNLRFSEYPSEKFKHMLDKFLVGKMVFSPNMKYGIKADPLSDKFLIINRKNNIPIFKLNHWVITPAEIRWSSDSRFIAYEYDYDQDDLPKIFVSEIETGKTLLLAAGNSPLWLEE